MGRDKSEGGGPLAAYQAEVVVPGPLHAAIPKRVRGSRNWFQGADRRSNGANSSERRCAGEHGIQMKIIMPMRVPKHQSSAAAVVRALQLMFNSVSQAFRMAL